MAPLQRARLADAERVLADACAFDRAAAVADEKLFGPGPTSTAQAFGAWDGSELVGVASVAARWLRLIAVTPSARGRGAGTALLAACEAAARTNAQPKLSVLAQPGNYLAPGVDDRNIEALAWLDKRGFERGAETRSNVLLRVRDNPRVTPERLAQAIATARDHGYDVRRAVADERAPLVAAIAGEFGGAWPFEVERAFGETPIGHLVAVDASALLARFDQALADAHPSSALHALASSLKAEGVEQHAIYRLFAAYQVATDGNDPRYDAIVDNMDLIAGGPWAKGGALFDKELAASAGVSHPVHARNGVHVAVKDGIYCAFAAHDGNNRGLGWFGPTGTWPAHRGQGLGEALLLACLVDVAASHAQCEVAWIGPRPFYDKVAGIASERRFVTFTKPL